LTPNEVLDAAQGLSYQGREISLDEIRVWLSQFCDANNQRLMLRLLKGVKGTGLYTPSKFSFALGELHKLAINAAFQKGYSQIFESKRRVQNWFVTHADPTGKSGSQTVKQYRNINGIYETHCGDPTKVVPTIIEALREAAIHQVVLICVDDFVGTGVSAAADVKNNVLASLNDHVPDWSNRVLLIYGAVVAYEEGLERITDALGNSGIVVCYRRLTAADKPFNEETHLLKTP